jgi:peptide-methionine (S)-S-oxide reductase
MSIERRKALLTCLSLVALAGGLASAGPAAANEFVVPPPQFDDRRTEATETAVLAGGCFWGVQAIYQHVKGVSRVVSGYAGGTKGTATYDTVSSGRTGHAESVEITFDPRVVSYGTILQIFFSVAHDPTELNRQGPDVGTQYRSAIFTQDPAQRRVAEAYVAQLGKAGVYKKPIVTQINGAEPFYAAEAYHQDYATLHPYEPYILFHDRPKIEAFKRLFPEQALGKPVLLTSAGKTN